jgi:hypothetical protein
MRDFHKRFAIGNQSVVFTPSNVAFDFHSAMMKDEATFDEGEMYSHFEGGGKSLSNRVRMVGEIQALKLTCAQGWKVCLH